MSTSVGGQIITAPDISTLALLADIQYFEPYSASALNRKMRGVVLPGIYSGFTPRPGGGLNLLITSTDVGTGALSVDVGAYFQVNVQQIKDILIPLSAGRSYIIVCEGNYAYGTLTKQVSTSSNIDAARIFAIPVTQALAQNQLELCRLTIPNGATAITQQMIDGSHRITRALGVLLSDATNSSDPTVAASSKAVKDALDAAKADSATRLVAGAMGIGAQAINFAQNFDWQTYPFHGGECVLIDWGTARNNPPLGYPNGAYQITVMGLSNTDNQSLLIRPVNELLPLTPFFISWTGAAGARDIRFRGVHTNWPDITSITGATPNLLTTRANSGTYDQNINAGALVSLGYPIQEAGVLTVSPGPYGVVQEYTTYASGRKFFRASTSESTFNAWSEYPTFQRDLFMARGKLIGVEAGEANRVYLDNRTWGMNEIVGGVRSEWYGHNAYAGLRRSTDVNIIGYSIELDGAERLRLNTSSLQLYLNQVGVYDNNPAYCLYASNGVQLGNIQADATKGTLRIWNGDNTTFNFQNGMINSVGKKPSGPTQALLRGETEGSGWGDWRSRSSGLQVDMPATGTAYTIWKATRWGDVEIAAMSAAKLNVGNSVRLHVGVSDFIFDENGNLAAPGVISAANGQTRLASNAVYVVGAGNKHLWFQNAAGNEVGLIYASDDYKLHLRAAAGPSLDIDSGGNVTMNGVGTLSAPNVYVKNTLNIGDNDSGLWAKGDGTISIRSNSGEVGYWNQSDFTLNINLKTAGTLAASNIELLGGEPFIDFHRPGTNQDYNVRLINDTDNRMRLVGSREDTVFMNEFGQFIGRGRGTAWNQEYGTTNIAAFNTTRFYLPAGDSWCPMIKGEGYKSTGYTTAVSYGYYISPLNVFNDPVISATNDNGSFGMWRFNNQGGGITYWNRGGSKEVIFDSDLAAKGFISNVQRGAPVSPGRTDDYGGVEAPQGCVLTNARHDPGAPYGILITYRPLQILVNGAWRTIDG